MLLAYIIFFTLIGSVLSLIGSLLLLVRRNISKNLSGHLISLAAGVLLGTAFFDLLPEAAEAAGSNNFFTPVLLGFVGFFFAERFIHLFHHHHEHKGEKTPSALILIGDGVHNFIDGVVITASFLTSIPLGITTSIAVAAHEIPQEIADMSILLTNGLSKRKAVFYNFLSALTAIAGAILAYFFSNFIQANLYLFLSVTAGFFIYISASDLIPDIHEKYLEDKKFTTALTFILGIVAVYIFVKIFEG